MSTLREAAEEALRWMEHARLHLTIKERMHPDGLGLYDNAAEALRAALAQPKTELRDQHKAFTHWYFGLRGINEANFSPEDLAWAAWKAALAQPETEAGVSWGGHSVRGDADSIAEVRRLIDFEQARQGAKPATGDDLRVYDSIAANYNAQPEPVAWRTFDGEGGYDYRDFYQNEDYELEWKRLNPAYADWVTPLYARPPRDEWRDAVHDELVTTWTFSAENKDDPRKALQDIINWHVSVALDPAVSSDAQALIERGKAMRDVTPPTESPIATKCQRIEGSGEIGRREVKS